MKYFNPPFFIIILFLFFTNSHAQQTDSLRSSFQKPWLKIGALFQTMGEINGGDLSGNNGFYVNNMRIKIAGDLDGGFGYCLLTNLIRSSVVLDAYVYYRISPQLRIDAGQFRAPSGAEYTTIAGEIDFTERSWVSDRLSPGRQTGIQLLGTLLPEKVFVRAGIFNGNGIGNTARYQKNDDDQFMVAGRLDFFPKYRKADFSLTDDVIRLGMSGYYSHDTDVKVAGGEPDSVLGAFSGTRKAVSGDFRFQSGPFFISGEATALNLIFDQTESTLSGFHFSSGWMVTTSHQLVIRYQELHLDGISEDLTAWTGGLNWYPSVPVKFQFNVSLPKPDNPENFRLFAKWQLMF